MLHPSAGDAKDPKILEARKKVGHRCHRAWHLKHGIYRIIRQVQVQCHIRSETCHSPWCSRVIPADERDPALAKRREIGGQVEALQAQAEEALAKLEKDPQADDWRSK